jgi:hypothetical protein
MLRECSRISCTTASLFRWKRMGWKADRRQGRGPPCGRGAPGLTCINALVIERTTSARKYTNVDLRDVAKRLVIRTGI